jgi:hypothetical protein
MMAWMYMVVCICDFILFPVGFTVVQFWETQAANDAFRQWNPITIAGGGLFHLAMGAILGVAAWSRGKEKIIGVAGEGIPMTMHHSSEYVSQSPVQMSEPDLPKPQVRRPG